jgi:hypothetical protein
MNLEVRRDLRSVRIAQLATLRRVCVLLVLLGTWSRVASAKPDDWRLAVGASFFKWSAGKPNEIAYNAVSDRWERIAQDPNGYSVSNYQALTPLYFNMSFGVDAFIRYRSYLFLKLGYDYSNPFGIGGSGRITYTDRSTGITISESKDFSFSSHQLSYYIGPIVSVGDADLYLGFTPMGPTWVNYHEKYTRSDNGTTTRSYDMSWHGLHGNCRALIGIQVPVAKGFKIGSEATFVFMNYMTLTSGGLQDHSFEYPFMRWTVTARYEIF